MRRKYYHGTSEEIWGMIKEEGILLGKRGPGTVRMTWLTPRIDVAKRYGGSVVIEVNLGDYDCGDDWQFWTYEAIPLKQLTRLK